MKLPVTLFIALLTMAATASADFPQAATPGPGDKCQTCGMFVAKYPEFLAQIRLKKGPTLFFDGAKDMFKQYLKMGSAERGDITAIYVTGYYNVKPIDATKALYVTGSDVNGPMGAELVSFPTDTAAKEFMRDHKGKRILRFKDVTPAVIKELD